MFCLMGEQKGPSVDKAKGSHYLWAEHLARLCLLPNLQQFWEIRVTSHMLQIKKLRPLPFGWFAQGCTVYPGRTGDHTVPFFSGKR